MKYFDFHRFLNVARWDLTINSKFYLRSSLLVIILCCIPVLMPNLYAILTGNYNITGGIYDNIGAYVFMISLVGGGYCIIASGYMFHNFVTRQGRINELTLPATNLERFVWRFLLVVIGAQIVWLIGVFCADVLHWLFRLGFPTMQGITIETHSISVAILRAYYNWHRIDVEGYNIFPFFVIMIFCFVRTFSLVNAWKYRYNIPLTILMHFLLFNGLGLLLILFATSTFASSDAFMAFMEKLSGMKTGTVVFCMYTFAILLYAGILCLTYWLYTRAQLTTKRNP